MQSINASSLAPGAREWLANSRYPRILHVFDQACNLVNESREVLSIVTPQIGNGPFNLVIEDAICLSGHLGLLSPISISANQLILGDLTINTENAKLWPARPDWHTLQVNRENILNQLTSLPITNYQPLLPYSLTSNLCSALAMPDLSSALKITPQLAGLGNGLTPAGDDFLLGVIYAVWIIHPPEVAGALAQEIADTAAPLTTSLSAAWLRSAGKGEVGAPWHDFFNALISTSKLEVKLAVEGLLSIGHTSGADALAGFIGHLMVEHERRYLIKERG